MKCQRCSNATWSAITDKKKLSVLGVPGSGPAEKGGWRHLNGGGDCGWEVCRTRRLYGQFDIPWQTLSTCPLFVGRLLFQPPNIIPWHRQCNKRKNKRERGRRITDIKRELLDHQVTSEWNASVWSRHQLPKPETDCVWRCDCGKIQKRNETRGERGNETSSRSISNVCALHYSRDLLPSSQLHRSFSTFQPQRSPFCLVQQHRPDTN